MPRITSPIPTRVEAAILKILWKSKTPLTVAQVSAQLPGDRHYNTVLTILRIMETKGYAKRASSGRADLWRPGITHGRAIQLAIADLEKTFGVRLELRAAA